MTETNRFLKKQFAILLFDTFYLLAKMLFNISFNYLISDFHSGHLKPYITLSPGNLMVGK